MRNSDPSVSTITVNGKTTWVIKIPARRKNLIIFQAVLYGIISIMPRRFKELTEVYRRAYGEYGADTE